MRVLPVEDSVDTRDDGECTGFPVAGAVLRSANVRQWSTGLSLDPAGLLLPTFPLITAVSVVSKAVRIHASGSTSVSLGRACAECPTRWRGSPGDGRVAAHSVGDASEPDCAIERAD
ncbi:hypothetical protein CH251_03000 [Rhodococcus sp. 06-462-5]|nr:hypothetical protein CH251_03000 [Rhodococcus sp. 06-462-5]OZE62002.1 hypothetical protein CH270_20175 [Rhodococcus sp. 02-925g]